MTAQLDGYLRARSTCRSTGTVVELYDTTHPANVFDPDGGRWVTICQHGALVNHLTLELARGFMAVPGAWCGECETARRAREGL